MPNKHRSGHCKLCGVWRRSLHRDHILPKFKGGSDDEANIQLICANCHEDKTADDMKGRTISEETKTKMRAAAIGNRNFSREAPGKMSASRLYGGPGYIKRYCK